MSNGYLVLMASVLTIREQEQTSAAARAVGGYEQLLKLEQQRRKLSRRGIDAKVQRNAAGQYILVES